MSVKSVAAKPKQVAQKRPAETTGTLGAAVVLIGAGLGLDTNIVAGLGILAGLAPGAVTWAVEHFGH